MRLLPLCLASVVKCVDQKDSGGRFALGNVNLQFLPDGRFRVEATDTHIMIRVTGSCGSMDGYPAHPGLEAIPKGAESALVPYKAWESAFAMAKRTTKKRGVFGNLRQLAVQLGTKVEKEVEVEKKTKIGGVTRTQMKKMKQVEQVVAFGATDLQSFPIEQVDTIQGRWVPTDDVLKAAKWNQTEKDAAPNICPKQMAVLMSVFSDILGEDESRVEMIVRAKNKPVWFAAKSSAGIEIEALIMPLVD